MPWNHPKPLPAMAPKTVRHYTDKVDQRGPEECWPWKGRPDKNGYGKMTVSGRSVRSIRMGWRIVFGEDPFPDLILHSCDNPPCHNPAHWRRGNLQDNMKDRDERGRTCGGDRHWAAMHPEEAGKRLNDARRLSPTGIARGDRSGARLHPERLCRGERCHDAKLTANQVREIRSLYDTGDYSQQAIANVYKVSQLNISCIVRRKTWKHV